MGSGSGGGGSVVGGGGGLSPCAPSPNEKLSGAPPMKMSPTMNVSKVGDVGDDLLMNLSVFRLGLNLYLVFALCRSICLSKKFAVDGDNPRKKLVECSRVDMAQTCTVQCTMV